MTLKLEDIEQQISAQKDLLAKLHEERKAASTTPPRFAGTHPLLAAVGLAPRTYSIVAQGDSWFDYPSWDLIDWLRHGHGHDIDNIAVAGSTLNDIVYGPVPKNFLGITQSQDTDRITELINRIQQKDTELIGQSKRLQAVLLSGGGNDIAGPEFFSFLNNALSSLENPNAEVLDGVTNSTFKEAYEHLIGIIEDKAHAMGISLHIFVHGYDYPWPDGRGFTMFNLVGPWFDDSFKKKNFPYPETLGKRYEILKVFIDAFNKMLAGLEASHPGVHYVNLRGTLPNEDEWANELHPKKEGFGKLADKINLALHTVLK